MANSYPLCAGFVVLNRSLTKTIIVTTHSGNHSFPKGKRESGETDHDAAIRELREESGLTPTDIEQTNLVFDEASRKGNPSVRYFVCYAEDSYKPVVVDEGELTTSEWIGAEQVYKLPHLKDARKEVLRLAIQRLS